MKRKKLFIFLITIIFKLNFALSNEVLYLLQSASNPDKVELITKSSNQNILYIQKKCTKCLGNALKLLSSTRSKFIIVLGIKPIENLFEHLQENKVPKALWSNFYFDPGLNLTNNLKILENTSVLISHRKGSTKINVNVNLENGIPSESQLSIWK